jgi:FkbM family methyltransferase
VNLKQRTGHQFIKSARWAFAGTPVHKWKITNLIYARLFDSMYARREVEVNFRQSKLIMPARDITITPTVMSGDFEKMELDIFELACKGKKVIIDIGANVGIYSVIAARLAVRDGKVHAFEPIAENLFYLEKNIVLNKSQNKVLVVPAAIGSKAGNLKLFLSDRQIGTHSVAQLSPRAVAVEVPVVTVDGYVKANKIHAVDVIKIDVEGYDGFVVDGAKKTLKKHKPTLFIEFNPPLLKACKYNPDLFLENLMTIYQNCYVIDEYKNRIYRATASNIKSLKVVTNINLVLSDDNKLIQKIENMIA